MFRCVVRISIAITCLSICLATSAGAQKMYWTEYHGMIRRANVDGWDPEDLLFEQLEERTGIVLHPNQGKMYLSRNHSFAGRIEVADLDGEYVREIVIVNPARFAGIALDYNGGRVYWTDTDNGKIQRAYCDGSFVEDIATGLNYPVGICLDPINHIVYWTDYGAGKIQFADWNDPVPTDLITGLNHPADLTIDLLNSKLYWTDWWDDAIKRADLDGSNVEDVVTVIHWSQGLALDLTNGQIYWSECELKKIRRCDLDGANIEDVLTTGLEFPTGITLDPAAGKMYWTSGLDRARRANLDGTDLEELLTPALGDPFGIALELYDTYGRMYWVDRFNRTIDSSNLDGTKKRSVIKAGLSDPISIALDQVSGMVYWADRGTGKIQRASLDGFGVQDLVDGLNYVYGLALDLVNGKMYWTETVGDMIGRSDLDGSNPEDLVTVSSPRPIALDVAGGKMYFAAGHIWRASLDGSNMEDLVNPDDMVTGIALDIEAGHMYWTEGWHPNAKIRRADFDGQNVVDFAIPGMYEPQGIALDLRPGNYGLSGAEVTTPFARPSLTSNYPNPFNPATSIVYYLPGQYPVNLHVFDALGRLVRSLRNGTIEEPGSHVAVWDGLDDQDRHVPSGVYLYRLQVGDFEESRSMVLIK